MAFRLSKNQLAAWERRIGTARSSLDALNEAITSFNRTLASAAEPLQGAAQAYNSALRELQSMAEQLAGDWRSSFNERTDRWQDGYRGQAVNEWIEARKMPNSIRRMRSRNRMTTRSSRPKNCRLK